MKMPSLSAWWTGALLSLWSHAAPPMAHAAPNTPPSPVVIHEILAANATGLRDEDGDTSDWIELFNSGTTPVSLDGWFLTDQPGHLTKWRFPDMSVGPGSYLVVFASGKDRAQPSALHTNFRLSRAGEYLGLVDAQTNVVSELAPAYPPQQPDVSYGAHQSYPLQSGFFPIPTPGAANGTNGASRSSLGSPVTFSAASGLFVQPFLLTLSSPKANEEIRFELVQSAATVSNLPTAASPVYTSPLLISNTVQVRARTFAAGSLPGPLRSESFVRLDTNLLGFSSDLPLVVLHTFGAPPYPNGAFTSNHTPGFMAIFEPRGGRTSLTNPPVTTTRIGVNVHGGATGSYPKPSFNLETWDEFNQDRNVGVLGMPPESDWLFHAANNFEPTMLNHSLINELSQQAGRYAPRTRLVEVFVSTNVPGSSIGSNQYHGVYAVMEKIKRSPVRVDLDRLDSQDTNAPAITGGYLLKAERVEPHEGLLPFQPLIYQNPEAGEIRRPERHAQNVYLSNYFASATTVLASPGFADPNTGYRRYLDASSWVDNHILNVFAFNVDAFRLGGFVAKPRDRINERGEVVTPGRLLAGPIYDFDRALGSKDMRDFNPRVWRSMLPDYGTDFFHHWWFDRLFRDSEFWQSWIDRWQELRQSTFSLAHLTALIDSLREEVREAQPRELRRWGYLSSPRTNTLTSGDFTYNFGTNGYAGEIRFLKHWLSNRVDFIDTNFVASPRLSVSGDVVAGFLLQLSGPTNASAVIYYTLDGTDPRLPGGSLAPGAAAYGDPILVSTNARLVARVRDLNHRNLTGGFNPPLTSPWSGPVAQTVVQAPPTLRITEVMYHPSGDPQRPLQYEYIELRNIGGSMQLQGFKLRGAVEFTFPSRILGSGEYVLVVGDRAGFEDRYGSGHTVAGQYNSPLDDTSGHVILEGPVGEVIHDFTYRNDWFPVTGGLGFSLVILSEYLPLREWEEGEIVDNWNQINNWRPSTAVNGSPGGPDPMPPNIAPIYVHEVLPRPEPGQTAFIELFNPHGPDANLSGWYLSDDFNIPRKYRIPDGTLLPVGRYLAFEESQFNASPGGPGSFALNPAGGKVYVFSADASGQLTGYAHGFEYEPSATGTALGRYLSEAGEFYVALEQPTPGSANAGPRIGPIVISEIHYHPVDYGTAQRSDNTADEYLELRNLTGTNVPLVNVVGPWRIAGSSSYLFPPTARIPASGYALVVRFDPAQAPERLAAFRSQFGIPEDVPIFGPLTDPLPNPSGLVVVESPELFVYSATRSEQAYITIDRVNYSTEEPWPAGANGIGLSLNRHPESTFGDNPFNWVAVGPSPGSGYAGGELPIVTQQPQNQTAIAFETATFSVSATGPGPLQYQWRHNGQPLYGATAPTLVLTNVQPTQAGTYDAIVFNSAGSVASHPAALILRIPLSFVSQPQSLILRPGQAASFTVVVDSTAPPVRYQWSLNGAALPGATNSLHYIPSVNSSHAGTYRCAVTDGISTRQSDPADLTLLVAPVILQQPLSQSAVPGATVVFSVQVSNTVTLPVGYRWRRNGGTVRFQILNSLTDYFVVTNVAAGGPIPYTVVVTNAVDSRGTLSSNAVLTVVADTDGDGLPDAFELAHGLDASNPADAYGDRDGDSVTNLAEYEAGTNPDDASSYLRVDRVVVAAGVQLEFLAASNKTYTVQSTPALGSGLWSTVSHVVALPHPRTVVISDPLPGTNRFYRLVTPVRP